MTALLEWHFFAHVHVCHCFVTFIFLNVCIQVSGTRRPLPDRQICDVRQVGCKKARVELDPSDGGMLCLFVFEHIHCISLQFCFVACMLYCVSILCNSHIPSAGAESGPGGSIFH